MAEALLFVTGVLAGFIAGYFISRRSRGSTAPSGSTERLLEERLSKADAGLEQFSKQLEAQKEELRTQQTQLQEAREAAAVSRTQLESAIQERDALRSAQASSTVSLEQIRAEKEHLSKQAAEAAEKLRSQESQTQFLEQARADLLTQFRSLSGQMLDGSREALLKSTKETVSEPFAKEMEQLRQQMQSLQKESVEKLGVLAQTTMDLRQRSEDVQGAAQQLTSALRSPNVKGRWGEVNLRRILEFVGLISYCDFDEQVHVGTEDGAYRPDCVITIPGSRRLIVDSKAPIESYLDALRPTAETLADLSRPIDPRHLKTRKQGSTTLTYCPWNTIARHLHHRAPGWCWEVQSVQEVGGAVVVTGRLTIPTADGDLLHYSAVASEPMESKSQAPAAEVAASSCLRRAAALAGLGLELWG